MITKSVFSYDSLHLLLNRRGPFTFGHAGNTNLCADWCFLIRNFWCAANIFADANKKQKHIEKYWKTLRCIETDAPVQDQCGQVPSPDQHYVVPSFAGILHLCFTCDGCIFSCIDGVFLPSLMLQTLAYVQHAGQRNILGPS